MRPWRSTDAHVEMVVVPGEHLNDGRGTAQPRVRPNEDASGPRADEEVDERLREPKVDLRHLQGRALASVQPRVVDVDVQAVLMRDVARTEPASVRPAEVPDADPRRTGV